LPDAVGHAADTGLVGGAVGKRLVGEGTVGTMDGGRAVGNAVCDGTTVGKRVGVGGSGEGITEGTGEGVGVGGTKELRKALRSGPKEGLSRGELDRKRNRIPNAAITNAQTMAAATRAFCLPFRMILQYTRKTSSAAAVLY